MKIRFRMIKAVACIAAALLFCAQDCVAQKITYLPPKGKEVYIPRDLRDNDFTNEDSKWSYARMAYTKDVIVFWEKPFGNMLSKAPELDGQNMKVDINNLLQKLQIFYNYYKNNLGFIKPGSKADKYRMMVMLNYTLEGTAYGGDYDGTIGALWISPNRVQDLKLNCIAHELGHSFQSQIGCDGEGESWGGGGIFEMASQWMLWQVNPQWTTDEHYHWKAFVENMHRRFLDVENIYHSPFVLEYWAMKRGNKVIADLFREGKKGEDPASTYMKKFNLSVEDMSNEMVDCYSRLVSFDFPRVKNLHRKFIGDLVSNVNVEKKGKKQIITPAEGKAPQTWGFNVVELELPKDAKKFTLTFNGLNKDKNAEYKTCLVNIDASSNAHYSEVHTGASQSYNVKMEGKEYYLVIVGCPKNTYTPYTFNPYGENSQKAEEPTFPYEIVVK